MFGLKENMELMQPFTDNIKEEITLIWNFRSCFYFIEDLASSLGHPVQIDE